VLFAASPDHEWSGYYHHASSSWLKPPEGALDGSRVIYHPAGDAQAVEVVYESSVVRFRTARVTATGRAVSYTDNFLHYGHHRSPQCSEANDPGE